MEFFQNTILILEQIYKNINHKSKFNRDIGQYRSYYE